MYLSELQAGETGKVAALLSDENIRRRLQDIGVIPGTRIECLMFSPLGDPAAYLIRGAVIALRKTDTATIELTKAGD